MKQLTILLSLLFGSLTSLQVQAQINSGGQPYSFQSTQLTKHSIPTVKMPHLDIEALKAEDVLTEDNKQTYRFGASIAVDLNLQNTGKWETLENGDRIWRLQIYSNGAKTINLIYNDFYLPKGATLFLYNADKSQILGAFTSNNNKPYRKFSTSLLRGNRTTLEYYEPANVTGKGAIQVSEVIHGYRSFEPKIEKGFGDSGDCNINVNCPDGMDWQVQKRSIAMIIAGGQRDCTGAVVNNIREDGTPYFLTADHCLPNNPSNVETWLFVFNYESPNCSEIDGPLLETISGSILRANSPNSDFALLELSEVPPLEYTVYYAGWTAEDVAANETVCIHHPAGDIKKISFNNDPVLNHKLDNTPPNTFWQVTEWERGTTEGGSSGSPLFDTNKRIVGQLFGGFASCTNISWDTYGKFSYSWDKEGSINTQLKDWLDPDDTGILVIDGMEGNEPEFDLDASVLTIASPKSSICGAQSVIPSVLFRNVGAQSLNTAHLYYVLDGEAGADVQWQGNLDFFDSEWIDFPPIELEVGMHNLVIAVENPNDDLDMNPSNNFVSIDFEVTNGTMMEVVLKTDRFGSETSFQIEDEAGNIITEKNNFGSDRTYRFDYCLNPECYTFTIFDSYEGPDGLGDGICCGNGEGSYTLQLMDGTILGTGGEFQSSESVQFCVEDKQVLEAGFVSNQQQICMGEAVQFTALSEGAANYNWTFEGGIPATSAEPNPSVVFEDWGSFGVSLEVSNSVSNDALEVDNYIVVNGIDLDITPSNASNPIDADGSVALEVMGSSNVEDLAFEWSNGINTSNPGQLARGNYSVLVTDLYGCISQQAFSIDSDIRPMVAAIQVERKKVCEGEITVFEDVSNNEALSHKWLFVGAEMLSSSEQNPSIEFTQSGLYDVQLVVADAYTRDTLLLENFIEVGSSPNLSVETSPPQLGEDDGEIELTVLDGTSSTTIKWDSGKAGTQLRNLGEGTYGVTVTNEFGCQKTLEIPLFTLAIVPDGFLLYPNPAQGGLLRLHNRNPVDTPVSFKVYGMEGRLMGEWYLDGSSRNYELDVSGIPSGVYLFKSNIGGKERQEKLILLHD